MDSAAVAVHLGDVFRLPVSQLADALATAPAAPPHDEPPQRFPVSYDAAEMVGVVERERILPGPGDGLMARSIRVPASEYGDALGVALIDVTHVGIGVVDSGGPALAALPGGEMTIAGDALLTLRDAVRSVAHALAQLTTYRVPGYDAPLELLQAIAAGTAVEEMAALLPIGVLAPMSNNGLVFAGPVVAPQADGSLALRAALRAHLQQEQRHYKADLAATAGEVHVARAYHRAAGAGCPCAHGRGDEPTSVAVLTTAMVGWIAAHGIGLRS